MPWNRPTLQELIKRNEGEFFGRLVGGGAILRRSILRVLARAWAGMAHLQHGFLQWISQQIFASTAETEQLERHGLEWGITRKAATYAGGICSFAGMASAYAPAGTVLLRVDGLRYVLLEAVLIDVTGTATAPVQAEIAGDNGNALPETVLEFETPITGLGVEAVTEDGLAGGVNTETDDALRVRILQRKQLPPMGGADHDYKIWATSIPGVTGAEVFGLFFGGGTVLVTCGNYENSSPIVPDATIEEVRQYIQTQRPVTASVTVKSTLESQVAVAIKLNPNQPEVQAEIEAEIVDLFRRQGRPGKTISLAQLDEVISAASGELDHKIVSLLQESVEVTEIVLDTYHSAVLQGISFTGYN